MTPADNSTDLDNLRKEYTRACRDLTKRKRAKEETRPANPIVGKQPASDAGQFHSNHDFSAAKASHLTEHRYLEIVTGPGYSKVVSIEALVRALHKNSIVAQEILEELKLLENEEAEKASRHD